MTTEQRLLAVEQSVRRWRAATVILAVLVVVAIAVAAYAPATHDVVRARRIEVRDENSDAWVVLNSDAVLVGNDKALTALMSGGLTVTSHPIVEETTPDIAVGATPDGPYTTDGGAMFNLYNPHGERVATMQSGKDNGGLVVVSDFQGRVRGRLPFVD